MAEFDSDPVGLKGDDLILHEARRDYKRCQEWFGEAYKNSLDDTKFANGDCRNHDQWPDVQFNLRDDEQKPCLTVSKVRTHNDICINEAMRNKSSIKIRPTGGQASYVSSQMMQSVIRRIEHISKGVIAYRKAITDQIDGGFGYVRLETSYTSDRSFDQDIYIRGCRDPRGVFIDPDCKEQDGSDGNLGFEFERMKKEEFNKKYPKYKGLIGKNTVLGNNDIWLTEHHIQVAMYYQRKGASDTFIRYTEPTSGKVIEKMASEVKDEAGKELLKQLLADIESGEVEGKTREVMNQSVKWYLIAGDKIVERGDWAGRHVPIIPCWGRYIVIEGKLDIKGHTRAMIDAQRMLNYNASAFIEYGALQSKSPWVASARAIEGQEQWKDANTKNYSVLVHNDLDEEAADPQLARIEPPQRAAPPQSAPVYAEGMVSAERWMMMVSGQYHSEMGEGDHESASSGRAINERQRQSDTATWHFNEGQSDMFRAIGTQLTDLIPKIYDTERRLHVLGEDGTKSWIVIKPDNEEAIRELKKEEEEAAILEFNPNVGEYECVADVGPSYATQRQEAWDALSQLLQQNIALAAVMGDLYFKYGDFSGADELADRMKKEIQATKPYLFDDSKNPGLAAMQEQLQKLQALNAELMTKLAEMNLKLKGKEEKRDIEAYNAETNRMNSLTKHMDSKINALAKMILTPAQQAQMEHDLMTQERQMQHDITTQGHDHVYGMIRDTNAAELANEAAASDAGE